MRTTKTLAALAILTTLTACDRAARQDLASERESRSYRAAMADYKAGRVDAALAGFEKTIREEPANASARFQYACLLQDKKHDWLGAICHYREFLLQSPGSDKAKLAKDRLAICEQMYANKLAKAGAGDAAAPSPSLAATERKCAKLAGELETAEARLAALSEENARLRRMLGAVGADGGAVARSADDVRSLLDDDEGDRLKISPDAQALFRDEDDASDAARTVPDDVLALGREEDDGPRVALPQGRSTAGVRKEPPKTEEPPHEEKPATYVVQEGDTLYKLALRFYGKRSAWQRIRDANKATVTTDGRIQTGQTLVLP